jgi:hypothetical protein
MNSDYSLGVAVFIGIGLWGIITSSLVIVFARKLNANPMQHTKWGALIIVFTVIGIGLVGAIGLIGLFGAFLAFLGGILALVYKPDYQATPQYVTQPPAYGPPIQPTAYQQPTQQPTAHYCIQCGTVVQPSTRFCPNCGKQQD